MFNINAHFNIQSSIVALSIVSLIVMMGASMVTPSLALYAKSDLGADEFLVGAAIAGFAIGRLVFDVPSGFLADRVGINRTMVAGLGILAGASVLAGFAPSYWVLLLARIVEGIGSSVYVTSALTFVLLSSGQSMRATNIGTYQSILMLGPIMGPVVGAPIAAFFGYNAPYFAFAGFMLMALLTITIFNYKGKFDLKRMHVDKDGRSSGNITQIGGGSRMAVYLNSASFATFGFAFLRSSVYTTGMPLFAYGNLHLSVFDVGIMLTMASLANLGASFFSGRLTQRYGMQRSLFCIILFSSVLVALIPFSTTLASLMAIMTMLGITSGFFGQSIAWAANQVEEKVKKHMVGEGERELHHGQEDVNDITTTAEGDKHQGIHSHLTRGIGFNRMVGDMGLILGPLFIGYLIAAFTSGQIQWLAPFVATSAILGMVSFLIIGASRVRNLVIKNTSQTA